MHSSSLLVGGTESKLSVALWRSVVGIVKLAEYTSFESTDNSCPAPGWSILNDPVNDVFVSFELCFITRYGCIEYSVSLLEFFCRLSRDFLNRTSFDSNTDGIR